MTSETSRSELNLKRFSGIRLRSPFQHHNFEIANLAQQVVGLMGDIGTRLQRTASAYFLDDAYYGDPDALLWARLIQEGEVLVVQEYKDGPTCGVAMLSDIKMGARVRLRFNLDPKFADAAMREIMDYCFKLPPEGGLGCLCIATSIPSDPPHPNGYVAIGAGFQPVREVVEACYHGRPTTMLLLELMNPALYSSGENLNGSTHDDERAADATGEPSNGDEPRGLRADLRGGETGAVDIDNGDAAIEPVSSGLDGDR